MAARNDSSSTPSDRLRAVAATWLARRDAGLTEAEDREFETWLAADARHAAAWAELESAWLAFDQPREIGVAGAMVCELAARRRRRRWKVYSGLAAGVTAAAAAVVLLFARAPSPSPHLAAEPVLAPAGPTLQVSRPERRVLDDGSMVELNASARIAVEFLPGRRGVRLIEGEAHFTVTENPARPFVVTAANVEVRAVGTAFAVKLTQLDVGVVVTEGRVAVDRAVEAQRAFETRNSSSTAQPASATFASVGSRVSVPIAQEASGPWRVEPVAGDEMQRLLAWRGPRLDLSGTPLAGVVEVFNRENPMRIVIADRDLAAMQMSGIFRVDNPAGFVRLLETNYDVRAERRGGEIILRKAR